MGLIDSNLNKSVFIVLYVILFVKVLMLRPIIFSGLRKLTKISVSAELGKRMLNIGTF